MCICCRMLVNVFMILSGVYFTVFHIFDYFYKSVKLDQIWLPQAKILQVQVEAKVWRYRFTFSPLCDYKIHNCKTKPNNICSLTQQQQMMKMESTPKICDHVDLTHSFSFLQIFSSILTFTNNSQVLSLSCQQLEVSYWIFCSIILLMNNSHVLSTMIAFTGSSAESSKSLWQDTVFGRRRKNEFTWSGSPFHAAISRFHIS